MFWLGVLAVIGSKAAGGLGEALAFWDGFTREAQAHDLSTMPGTPECTLPSPTKPYRDFGDWPQGRGAAGALVAA